MEIIDRPCTAESFNIFLHEKRLMGAKCSLCNMLYLPPRAICPNCFCDSLTWHEFNGRGKLLAFTVISDGLSSSGEKIYHATGIVELVQGVKISAHILGVNEQQPDLSIIGSPVHIEYVELLNKTKTVYQLSFKLL